MDVHAVRVIQFLPAFLDHLIYLLVAATSTSRMSHVFQTIMTVLDNVEFEARQETKTLLTSYVDYSFVPPTPEPSSKDKTPLQNLIVEMWLVALRKLDSSVYSCRPA